MVSAVVSDIYISYCLSSHETATATSMPGLPHAPLFKVIAWLAQVQLQHQWPLTTVSCAITRWSSALLGQLCSSFQWGRLSWKWHPLFLFYPLQLAHTLWTSNTQYLMPLDIAIIHSIRNSVNIFSLIPSGLSMILYHISEILLFN
jgi:hypothetical protein